jgi:hypothetical protein
MNAPQETKLGHELRQLVSGQPFTPDIEAIGLRARRKHRRGLALRGATAAGAAVFLAAGGLFATVHGTGGTAAGTAASQTAVFNPKLVSLAAFVKASTGSLQGNASLVIETGRPFSGSHVESGSGAPPPDDVIYMLFTDSGAYYGANNKKGITAAVDHHENLAGGWGGPLDARPVVAAARYAATGDLTAARQRMLNATPEQPGNPFWIVDPWLTGEQFEHLLSLSPAARKTLWEKDVAKNRAFLKLTHAWPVPVPAVKALRNAINYEIWYNSIKALTVAAGNPQVREGVLRVLSTIAEVTVANSTTGGRPTLALTAAPALMVGAGIAPSGPLAQVVTISARTGIPISVVNRTPGQKSYSYTTTTFQVSRVWMSRVRAGRF